MITERTTAEILLEQILSEGAPRIVQFVQDQTSEDLYLDFITKNDPKTVPLHADDKHNYGKALSGFANSDGGLIVWGVQAAKGASADAPDVAQGVQPLSDPNGFVSHLNNLIPTITKPAVPGVRNVVVRQKPGGNAGYVVTYVPVGLNLPYRLEGNVHRYYKRAGGSFVEMEPYEIRDVIFRFRYPKVEVQISYSYVEMRQDFHLYRLKVRLHNHGPTTLKDYLFVVRLPAKLYAGGQNIDERDEERIDSIRYAVFSVRHRSSQAIFPGETSSVIEDDRARPVPILEYKVDFFLENEGLPRRPLLWTLFGDDMPPQSGAVAFNDLTNF